MATEGQGKIKQVKDLPAVLDTKVETASNEGTGGIALFIGKTDQNLKFNKLSTAGSVVPVTAVADLVVFNLVIDNIPLEVTSVDDADLLALHEDSSGVTKFITKANLFSGFSSVVEFTDYVSDTSVDADSIIFFDASDSNNANIESKSGFLSEHAKLNDPDFTGTPTAPTAATATEDTQIATTAFVHAVATAQSAGFAFLDNAIDIQVDNTLDPTASPTEGDRYILEDVANLNANFGTIDKDTEGNATTVGNDDVVEYDGTDFVILFDASAEGEGAFIYVTEKDKLFVFITSWNALDTGEIIAGAGLDKNALTLSVKTDGVTTAIVGDEVVVKSTWIGHTAFTTVGTLAFGTWEATTIAVAFGGTGLTSIAANTILTTKASANSLSPVTLAASQMIGRKATGNVAALTGAEVRTISKTREKTDKSTLTANSMLLGTLTQTPLDAANVRITINGIALNETEAYTISGTAVNATPALNVAYGGTASDGAGFENDDAFKAVYTF